MNAMFAGSRTLVDGASDGVAPMVRYVLHGVGRQGIAGARDGRVLNFRVPDAFGAIMMCRSRSGAEMHLHTARC
ncbi:hypothetical protein NKH86_23110 [Mesorhizobium sp. M0913]|uniref:hypothetical protein n=1 Tax=Mesorhizobium sp. M0913 TaxID=2957026 RepID=UPI00333CB22C